MRVRTILLAVLYPFIGLLPVPPFARAGEPRYNGRTLSEWVTYARTNTEASNAELRRIGTNALPTVLKWLRFEPQPWKDKALHRVDKLPPSAKPPRLMHWLQSNDAGEDSAEDALVVLEALGPMAIPAAPELLRLSRDKSRPEASERAVEALGCLGTNGFPQLIQILKDRKHPNRGRAVVAVGVVMEANRGATSAVPALVECLLDPDPELVELAGQALGEAETDPALYIVAYKKNLHSPNPVIRADATNAIRAIAPELLTNAVPK